MVVLVEYRDTCANTASGRTVGDRQDARVRWVALARKLREGLLLYAVRGDGAHLGKHILSSVEDACAAAECRFAVAENVVVKSDARLEFSSLIGKITG